jgi:CRISPR-associated protein Csb2
MSQRLRISVSFPAGRYHGAEWPPSPARLVQALVAGATAGCRIREWPSAEPALRWLEGLAPPEIVAPDAERGVPYTTYAPNNDTDALVPQLAQGKPLKEATRQILAPKSVRPWVLPDGARLHYLWDLAGVVESEHHATRVCGLARQLLALGWGIDVVAGLGEVEEARTRPPGALHLVPVSDGAHTRTLAAPTAGFLDDLKRAYTAFRARTHGAAVNTATHPTVYLPVHYRLAGDAPSRQFVGFDLRDERGQWQAFPWRDTMLVAAWLRHATKERMTLERRPSDWIESYVCGHTEKGKQGRRLSYVPLPSIGHEHSDGRIRRALLVLPVADSTTSLSYLRRLAGDGLVSEDGATRAWLTTAEADRVQDRYVGESSVWMSVTPVVLHGRDRNGGTFRPRKVERLLLQAFQDAGYSPDLIEEFGYQQAPYWRGAGPARQVHTPRHLSPWPRYHVRVQFRREVRGPLLIGIGRHYGLGVFAAP